jgi:hypothetical protein
MLDDEALLGPPFLGSHDNVERRKCYASRRSFSEMKERLGVGRKEKRVTKETTLGQTRCLSEDSKLAAGMKECTYRQETSGECRSVARVSRDEVLGIWEVGGSGSNSGKERDGQRRDIE